MNPKTLDRRTVLKGLGVTVALPALEAMIPGLSFTPSAAASQTAAAPKRMAFVYVPNGVNVSRWTPTMIGANYELPPTLQSMAPFKDDMLVLSGLTCDKARANGDGAGDHARAMSAFLTGSQPVKTAGTNIRVGVSIDQAVAQRMGNQTRFASLEIGCEGGRLAGNCDSGYSCAYSHNLSWRSETTPNPKEVNPRAVFDRLFGGSNRRESAQARARREQYNASVLDFVNDDARRLMNQLGGTDRRRLDEYLSSIRDVETRIARSSREDGDNGPAISRPSGVPGDFGEHLRIMGDVLALAFQADQTRVSTFVFANEGSNRPYRMIDIRDGHHYLSHHQNREDWLTKIASIDEFLVQQFAYFIGKLKSIPEGNGTLLDNCMIVYGSGNGDGNRHNHDDLPILLVGRGGGTIRTGRHLRYPRETPLTNLFLSMADRMGVRLSRHGDSTGRLHGLA